jgi:alpha-L-fucosidase
MIKTRNQGIASLGAAILLICFSTASLAQTKSAALQRWHDNKYSMFIHFGVYSGLGGVWQGKPVENGYSEQIHATAGIMADDYEKVPATFNPADWNADEIASLAKKGGMRSIVITSKHHDGFCMYKTETTRFNVVDATPFNRDIIRELSEACKKAGLHFGLYYSLIDYTLHPFTTHNANPITPDHHDYNKKQVTELLTNYGPISELWFDMGSLTSGQSREMYELVHRIQPDCMVSGRLGNNAYDFCVMGDNEYPDFKIDAPWQTPASMFDETWGYRSWQKRENVQDKIGQKLLSLIKVVSRGGNYLLNIGPKGDGSVVPFEAEVLLGVGKWLEKNGEAIYSTNANPFPEAFPWGEITTKGNSLYLILSGKKTDTITLPGISGKIKKIWVMNGPDTSLAAAKGKDNIRITVPVTLFRNQDFKVVVIEFDGMFHLKPGQLLTGKNSAPDFHNAIKHYSYSCIDYYNNHRSIVKQSWNFSNNNQSAVPVIYYTAEEVGKVIELSWNGEQEIVQLDDKNRNPLHEKFSGVKWGKRYCFGPVQSEFENLSGPFNERINPDLAWSNDQFARWSLVAGWVAGKNETVNSAPFQSYYILQEIDTESAADQLVETGGGDGIQVWLNGENLVKHLYPRESRQNSEVVLLPLKAGKNQLLIKFNNRYGYQLHYKINLNIEQIIYKKELSPRKFSGINHCELKLYHPESEHQPIRMNNIKIQF